MPRSRPPILRFTIHYLHDIRGGNFVKQTGKTASRVSISEFTVRMVTSISTILECGLCQYQPGKSFPRWNGRRWYKTVGMVWPAIQAEASSFARWLLQPFYSCTPHRKRRTMALRPGLPLRLKGLKVPDSISCQKSSVSDVYKQILSDLNDAEPACFRPWDASTNTTRGM